MGIWDFIKVNFEKVFGDINVDIKPHMPIDIDVDKRKTEIEAENVIEAETVYQADNLAQIGEQKNAKTIIEHLTINAGPGGAEALISTLTEGKQPELPAPADSVGATLPAPEDTEGAKCKEKLQLYLKEHESQNDFFLGIGQLLFFYEHRSLIDFSEEELVFLLQSSLKYGFPFWYWSLLHREKFRHVMPLLRSAFKTSDVKIRMEVIRVIGKFNDTADDIVTLSTTEENPIVLGKAITTLFVGKNEDEAQRVLSNSISRKIVPRVEYKDVQSLSAPLGVNEKKFLHKVIETGWPEDVVFALNILSLSPAETDLPIVEDVLENVRYTRATISALHCIARIGKANKPELTRKLLADTRQEEVLYQVLETIRATKDRVSLPELFDLIKRPESIHWRFSEINSWQYRRALDQAVKELFDKSFYEVVVEDILSDKIFGKNWGSYTWRQTFLLKSLKDNPEIVALVKAESRLNELPDWKEVVEEMEPDSGFEQENDKQKLIELIKPEDFEQAKLAAERLWKIADNGELLSYQTSVENLRTTLSERLIKLREDNTLTEDEQAVIKEDLDKFLGSNRFFFNLRREIRRKKAKEEKENGKEKGPFDLLLEDIGRFESIESGYVSAVIKTKTKDNSAFLLEQIGKPYEKVYEAIDKDWPELDTAKVKEALEKISKDYPNPMVRIAAISALRRLKAIDDAEARVDTYIILYDVMESLKLAGRTGDDKWIGQELTYSSCINLLSDIGNPKDVDLIEESVEREMIISRTYWRFAKFYDISAIKKLLSIKELITKDSEQESLRNTLEALDNNWSEVVLNIEKES